MLHLKRIRLSNKWEAILIIYPGFTFTAFKTPSIDFIYEWDQYDNIKKFPDVCIKLGRQEYTSLFPEINDSFLFREMSYIALDNTELPELVKNLMIDMES